ncbi:MAG: hypothetical protein AAGI68_05770 [Planctomycetota bacterium]
MSDQQGHPEKRDPQPEVREPGAVDVAMDAALGRALGGVAAEDGLSAEAQQRLLSLTDPEMTTRLDAALQAEPMPAGLDDRLVGLIDLSKGELEGETAVVGRIGLPATGKGVSSGWWRAAAMIGIVGGLVGLLVFGAFDRGSEMQAPQLVGTPAGGGAADPTPDGVGTEAVALTLSEELEALNGWLGSDASSSEGALDRQLSVFSVRLATVDGVSSSAPLSPDEVAEAAAGDAELQDDLDLLDMYGEEWVF